MTTCKCNRPLLATGHCPSCSRTPSWCRCVSDAPGRREPLWLTLSRERRGGLAKDLSEVAA